MSRALSVRRFIPLLMMVVVVGVAQGFVAKEPDEANQDITEAEAS